MGMDTENLTRKYYGYLKTLPNIKIFATTFSAESLFIMLRSFQLTFDYLFSFALYSILLTIIFKNKIKLALFLMNLTAIPYLLLSLLPIAPFYAFGFFMPLMAYILLSSYKEIPSIVLSGITSYVPIIFYVKYSIIFLIYIIVIGLIFHFYIYTVNRKGVKILGFKSTQVAVPFITAITEKNKVPLENFLNLVSVKTNLSVFMYKLDDFLFMIPQIHFGVFDSVGSSRFVYDIEKTLRNNVVTVFHGPGSHELDLPSSAEVNKVMEEISKSTLERSNWYKATFYGISIEKRSTFDITSLEFDKFRVSFMERPEFGIDDLPSSLWKYMLSSNNYLIDCHNSFLVKEYDNHEINSLKEFIMDQRGIKSTRKLLVGYAEGKLAKTCEGLCDSRIRVFTFDDRVKRVSIVYIYANNSTKELNNAISSAVRQIVDKVILVTPDDHSCTGISLGITYSPATFCEDIVNKASELIKRSTENMKEINSIEYKVVKIKGVKILGKIISIMLKALEDVGSYTSKTFWIPLVAPYVLLVVILLFQSLIKF
jgi:Predicted membrane protein